MNFSGPCRYAITQRSAFAAWTPSQYLERVFSTSADVVQWREKDLDVLSARSWARLGVRWAQRTGKPFLLNSHVELALSEGCHGVHLTSGQSLSEALALVRAADRTDFVVGQSVHSLKEALSAESGGADYVMLGPVFAPLSKSTPGPALGLDGLGQVVQKLGIPVAAVGGVEGPRMEEVFSVGAWAAAGITWVQREIRGLV